MKKTIITALLSVGFAACAAAESNFDSGKAATFNSLDAITTSKDVTTKLGTVTYTAPGEGSTMGRLTASTSEALYSTTFIDTMYRQSGSSLTFSLDLAAIEKAVTDGLSSDVVLVQFDYNSTDIGIMLTSDGTLTQFYGNGDTKTAYGDTTYSYAELMALDTFTMPSGESAAVLTATTGAVRFSADSIKAYLYTYDAEGTAILPNAGNYTNSNTVLNGIDVNTAFINDVLLSPLTLNAEGAADAAKAIPEPATATLSLLALAGLAARRRRQ